MRASDLLAPVIAALWLSSGAPGHATVLLDDHFNTENGGVGQLNYSGLANFDVTNAAAGGAVDLIPLVGLVFDFYPGVGHYIDICGSSSACGILTTKQTFGAGNYKITLNIGGNARNSTPPNDAVNVSFGTFSASYPLSEFQLATEVENVTLSAPSALTISDQGLFGPLRGDILFSVKVETVDAVPEPASLALLSAGLVVFGAIRRRRS